MPLAKNTLVLVTDGRKTLFFRNEVDVNQIDLRTESHDEREDAKDSEMKTDAPGAIEALLNGRFDCALLDYYMGLGTAQDVVEAVRSRGDRTPIIVLTGRVQDNWLAAWSRADAALPHPLDPMIVATTAADLLRTRLARLSRAS